MTKAEFCRERGLNINSFDNWCRKFRRVDATQQKQTQFIPVSVAPSQVSSPVTVSVGDVSVRFDAGMAPDGLGPWLQAMRGDVMLNLSTHTKVYLAREPLDMRRQIDGLALEVQEVLSLNPMSAHVFIFRNQRSDRVKGLYWDTNGFMLFYKRIERGRFQWPDIAGQSVQLGLRELQWLLEGQSLEVLRPSTSVAAWAV